MAVTNKNCVILFVVWTPHGKVTGTISFNDTMWKDIKEKLIFF